MVASAHGHNGVVGGSLAVPIYRVPRLPETEPHTVGWLSGWLARSSGCPVLFRPITDIYTEHSVSNVAPLEPVECVYCRKSGIEGVLDPHLQSIGTSRCG